jgi:hypothetical protein
MTRKIIFIAAALLISAGLFGQGAILTGRITDKKTGEAIPFATLKLYRQGKPGLETAGDIDGRYTFKGVRRGYYMAEVLSVGYQKLLVDEFRIRNQKRVELNMRLTTAAKLLPEVMVIPYQIPHIDKENTPATKLVTASDIEKNPGKVVLNRSPMLKMDPQALLQLFWQLAFINY